MSAASAARTAAGGKVFVTPMIRMSSGLRPARRAASATATRTAAARAATSSCKEPGLRERALDFPQREPDHVGERALDARDERRAAPLDRIPACLVERLAALRVRRDGGRTERPEPDARYHDLVGPHPPARCDQHEARDDPVLASSQAGEHRRRVRRVHGLADDVAVDLDHGVRSKHPRRPLPRGGGARVPGGEPLGSGLVALAAGDGARAAHLFTDAARRYPALADYSLYFGARAAISARRREDARALLARLLAEHPDSVWTSRAALLAGALARAGGDLEGARAWLATARGGL